MVAVTIRECAECGKSVLELELQEGGEVKLYGDGSARCFPKCDEKMKRRLNKRRGPGGRFVGGK